MGPPVPVTARVHTTPQTLIIMNIDHIPSFVFMGPPVPVTAHKTTSEGACDAQEVYRWIRAH
eukprot:3614266-Pyramimonas_sp.AAC.1